MAAPHGPSTRRAEPPDGRCDAATRRAPATARLVAYALDWCVFAAWAGLVFVAIVLTQPAEPWWPRSAWAGQALGFCVTTLPFAIYFVAFESGRRGATPGKRALGLAVTTLDGGRAQRRSAVVRTVAKLLPWELGHTAAHRMVAAELAGGAPPTWSYALAIAAMALALAWAATLFGGGRTPYDRLAGTRVVRIPAGGRIHTAPAAKGPA